jgi:hypothetical protein
MCHVSAIQNSKAFARYADDERTPSYPLCDLDQPPRHGEAEKGSKMGSKHSILLLSVR